ncbi:MAG: ATP-binding protein [Lachnospiraceae bacterium]|nr:ATP-binding protein [Lachnospiraceae bacterium]
MAVCLNTKSALILYQELLNSEYFVDKSGIIEKISKRIRTNTKYVCITKPRRFGKTSILNMLGAYYCKTYDARALFDNLDVSKAETYTTHLNKYNVINLCLSEIPLDRSCYTDYLAQFNNAIINDIREAYPALQDKEFEKASDALTATGDEFIFIIDEWDYIFSHELYPEHDSDFLEFLRNLLKDKPYVALTYMTGVLPLKKYSTGSALNMFKEYTMLKDPFFDKYFGFTEEEVDMLCQKQAALSMAEIRDWYNGYQTKNGARLYNPRSVICALEDETCQSYWTRTGRMDEVLFFLKYNIGEVRDDVVKMINGTPVNIEINKEYSAGQEHPASKKDIYAAMVIYGLLSYCDGELRIPNKELMLEFENALEDDDFGYVAELVKNSNEVLNATWAKQGDVVASYLHNIHNSELPILKYNDENSLSCVVTLAYLSARNNYRIEREDSMRRSSNDVLPLDKTPRTSISHTGKGFVDFIFYPRRQNLPGIILELKADKSPADAIAQIKEKEYNEKLEKEKVTHILAVGLNYDTAQKEHKCIIEELD